MQRGRESPKGCLVRPAAAGHWGPRCDRSEMLSQQHKTSSPHTTNIPSRQGIFVGAQGTLADGGTTWPCPFGEVAHMLHHRCPPQRAHTRDHVPPRCSSRTSFPAGATCWAGQVQAGVAAWPLTEPPAVRVGGRSRGAAPQKAPQSRSQAPLPTRSQLPHSPTRSLGQAPGSQSCSEGRCSCGPRGLRDGTEEQTGLPKQGSGTPLATGKKPGCRLSLPGRGSQALPATPTPGPRSRVSPGGGTIRVFG